MNFIKNQYEFMHRNFGEFCLLSSEIFLFKLRNLCSVFVLNGN